MPLTLMSRLTMTTMPSDSLPTDLLVNAQIRIAASHGVPIIVRRRGHSSSGTILLKINRLDGTVHLLTQVRSDDEPVWVSVTATDTVPEAEADRYLERQAQFDPDLWILEIEDKQGRHWFEGRRITFSSQSL